MSLFNDSIASQGLPFGTGSGLPGAIMAVAGSDGTDTRILRTDASGNQYVSGTFTQNSSAPAANTLLGALVAVATATAPTYTTGNLVALSVDLSGALRTTASLAGTKIPSDVFTNPTDGLDVLGFNMVWNGATWDRQRGNVVDNNNSSLVALGTSGVFTGTATYVLGYSNIVIYIFSNVGSATGGVNVQFSLDGVNWDETSQTTFTTGSNALVLVVPVRGTYYRLVYTNGASPQASFRLQTTLKVQPITGEVVEMNDTPVLSSHALLTRGQALGLTPGNIFVGASAATSADATANPTNLVHSGAMLLGFNGTTWDRVRVANTGRLQVDVVTGGGGSATFGAAFPASGVATGFTDGTNLVAGFAGASNADAVAARAANVQQHLALLAGYNGTTWDRLRSTVANGLAVDVTRVTGNVAVTGTFWQATQPVSATALPLPTGAATEATLAALSAKVPALGQALMAASQPVVIASNQSAVPVTGTFWQATQPISAAALPLPAGAATAANQASLIAAFPASLGQKAMAASMAVVVASDQSTIPVKQAVAPTGTLTQVASSASSVTILASNANRRGATIWNDSTAILYLAFAATATSTACTVKMVADAYYEVPAWYSGIITGIWAAANGAARITEVT